MANAMLDARQAYRRVELITGQRRRRRWTAEEKDEAFRESYSISVGAIRNIILSDREIPSRDAQKRADHAV